MSAKLSGAARTAVARQALIDAARAAFRRRDENAVADTIALLTAQTIITSKTISEG